MKRLVLLAAILPVLAFGCSTATYNVRVMLPSRADVMRDRQRVVIGDISGPWGYELARVLSEAISNARFHTLIDRQNERITAEEFERSLQTGGYIDPDQVGEVGATVVVSGTTERGEYSIERERRVVKKCVETNDEGECIRTRMVYYFDQRESCVTNLSVRVTRVADNVILFERGFQGYSNLSRTAEGDWPPRHESQLCSNAFYEASSDSVTWVTPFSSVVRLEFRRIKKSESTARALDFVEASMFDKAAGLFEAALGDPGLDEDEIGWARYNIAVIRWAQGDYSGCVDQAGMALDALGAENLVVEVRNRCVQYVR
ncbi:MAG TPA: hypothetical protein PLY68_05530 [Myxococcota bacterium]|nr:hypothetical protein [Myxococcota bacterium]HOD06541.1 hypothetical protein [Myxococcota bacterium]HPB50538.1 hypothetical protein [Myxococcota bacterium]HQP95641.1 hypothetical protein [Myxococcota bacterium]